MAVNLQPLIQLNYLDRQISFLNQNISKIPSQIQELDKKLERFNLHLQEKQTRIADNQKKRRELESDLALIETKRKRYKEQLDTVKTNKEYTALQHEIDGVSQSIRQIEDQILVQMEEAETLKGQLDEVQSAKEREEKVILSDKQLIEEERSRLQGQLDELKKQRKVWVDQIPPLILEVYDQIAMHRKGVAMAQAKDQQCQECQVRIRPQLYQEVRRNDTIIRCESCTRILFYLPPAEP